MPVDPQSPIRITAFDWVPDFARGFVRDLRPRWACEELGLAYSTRLISAVKRPESYYCEQPWGQVPYLEDEGISLFESGATLLHLAEKAGGLLPSDPQGRADVLSWLFAAFNSVEPWLFELANVQLFARDEEWAKLRKPSLLKDTGKRLDRLADALGDKEWLAGDFSIADIALVTMLRDDMKTDLLTSRPRLSDYAKRGTSRPAFKAAIEAQLADFKPEPVAA